MVLVLDEFSASFRSPWSGRCALRACAIGVDSSLRLLACDGPIGESSFHTLTTQGKRKACRGAGGWTDGLAGLFRNDL